MSKPYGTLTNENGVITIFCDGSFEFINSDGVADQDGADVLRKYCEAWTYSGPSMGDPKAVYLNELQKIIGGDVTILDDTPTPPGIVY